MPFDQPEEKVSEIGQNDLENEFLSISNHSHIGELEKPILFNRRSKSPMHEKISMEAAYPDLPDMLKHSAFSYEEFIPK